MRNNETVETEKQHVTTTRTYDTDCFRKVVNQETGKLEIKRWCEARSVGATLVAALGGVFHNGARIA